MSKLINPLLSILNLVVALALLATGIDHWATVPTRYHGYFANASICLGLFSVISGLILIAFEFQLCNAFFYRNLRGVMIPPGRGILYLLLSILTAGNTWYQILSVIITIVIGLGFIILHHYLSNITLQGLIPHRATSSPTTDPSPEQGNDLTELNAFSTPHPPPPPVVSESTAVPSTPNPGETVVYTVDPPTTTHV